MSVRRLICRHHVRLLPGNPERKGRIAGGVQGTAGCARGAAVRVSGGAGCLGENERIAAVQTRDAGTGTGSQAGRTGQCRGKSGRCQCVPYGRLLFEDAEFGRFLAIEFVYSSNQTACHFPAGDVKPERKEYRGACGEELPGCLQCNDDGGGTAPGRYDAFRKRTVCGRA